MGLRTSAKRAAGSKLLLDLNQKMEYLTMDTTKMNKELWKSIHADGCRNFGYMYIANTYTAYVLPPTKIPLVKLASKEPSAAANRYYWLSIILLIL